MDQERDIAPAFDFEEPLFNSALPPVHRVGQQ